jgi:hypothetical protein
VASCIDCPNVQFDVTIEATFIAGKFNQDAKRFKARISIATQLNTFSIGCKALTNSARKKVSSHGNTSFSDLAT